MVGLMTTSCKRAYVIPTSAAPRAPVPAAGHCWPISLQETLKQFWLSVCRVSGSWCSKGSFEPSECLWWVRGLILNAISPLLPSCWGFSFAPGRGVFCFFFDGIQCSRVNGCLAESCSFGVLTAGEDECKSLYSAIFQAVLLNIQKTKIMASSPITSWQIDWETMKTVDRLYSLGLQNYCRWWLEPWN